MNGLGRLDHFTLGDVMLTLHQWCEIDVLRQRAINAPQRADDRHFFAGMERAAAFCDVQGHDYVVEQYPRQRETAQMARRCAEAIRARARALAVVELPIPTTEAKP